ATAELAAAESVARAVGQEATARQAGASQDAIEATRRVVEASQSAAHALVPAAAADVPPDQAARRGADTVAQAAVDAAQQAAALFSGADAKEAAKAVTDRAQLAVEAAAAEGVRVASLGAPSKTKGTPSFPMDLYTDDAGQADLGDFQMFLIAILAVMVYAIQ